MKGRSCWFGCFSSTIGWNCSNWISQENNSLAALENSNVAKLASPQYLSVHSLPQEDCYDTDDASVREIYPILVPQSTMCTVQPSRRRQHRASVVDRGA